MIWELVTEFVKKLGVIIRQFCKGLISFVSKRLYRSDNLKCLRYILGIVFQLTEIIEASNIHFWFLKQILISNFYSPIFKQRHRCFCSLHIRVPKSQSFCVLLKTDASQVNFPKWPYKIFSFSIVVRGPGSVEPKSLPDTKTLGDIYPVSTNMNDFRLRGKFQP